MPAVYEGAVQDLIDEFGELPGIGPKSAQRMAFHILSADSASVERLIEALRAVKARVRFCRTCGNISESEQCAICRDPRRDQRIICVVEESKDVVAIERTREYRGLYHVLGGAIDPINGVGPDDLRMRELFARVSDGDVRATYVKGYDTGQWVEAGSAHYVVAPDVATPMGTHVLALAEEDSVGAYTVSESARERTYEELLADP